MDEKKVDQFAGQDFVIEHTYDAPMAIVWSAITDRAAIKTWFMDFEDFRPEVGCQFHFTGKDNDQVPWLHRSVVTEVIPLKKIAYTWRYEGQEGSTLVTMELFDEAAGTRLKLTHSGLDTPPKIPAFVRENFVAGWTELIGLSLRNYIEQQVEH